jgi:hypothetical protein
VLYAANVQTNGDKYATRRIGHRYTVPEAAEALGVTVDAIRSRIKRHTIMHVREDGRVYVLLSGHQGATSHDQDHDQGTAHHADQPLQTGPDHRDELLEELRDRVRALEEANRENRRIIAGLVQRIPELEAAPEPRDEPETVAESSKRNRRTRGTYGGSGGRMGARGDGAAVLVASVVRLRVAPALRFATLAAHEIPQEDEPNTGPRTTGAPARAARPAAGAVQDDLRTAERPRKRGGDLGSGGA